MSAATAGFKMSEKQYVSGNFSSDEVPHEMQVKMSKKIAQLTKVIYALNTKNDEHEALVNAQKKQHTDELERVLASSREKLARCQSLIGQDSEYRRRIGQLEGSLAEAQERQAASLREFGDFKVRVESRERELAQQQAQKAKDMTKQVTDIQEAYDRAIERFQGLLSEAKAARQRALDEQKAAYEKKLDEVGRSQRDIEASLNGATQKVHENYKAEIDGLRSRLDQEQASRGKDAQDYEDKLKKQQQFHKKEIEALRTQAESGKAEELDRLKRQHDELRKEHLAHQADARKERQGLIEKLAKAEDLAERLRLDLSSVGQSDSAKDAEIARLSSELKASSDDLKLQQESMRSLSIELQTATDKCEQQLKDIVKKSESIGELQASVLQHEGTIRRQAEELAQLQRQWDDQERQQSNKGREQDGLLRQAEKQVQRLEHQLQQLREEKMHAERLAEEEKQRLMSEMDSKERSLLQKQDKEAKQALKKYQDELKKQKAGFDSEVELLNQENSSKLELARNAAEKDKKEAQKELARLKRELEALAKARDERLRELEGQLRDKESGLGSASETLDALKAESARLQAEAEEAVARAKAEAAEAARLRQELDRLRSVYEQRLKESKKDLNQKMNELSAELDKKWADTLRRETAKLRQEYDIQSKADSSAGLKAFKKMKEDEAAEAARQVEARERKLKAEADSLREAAAVAEAAWQARLEEARNEAERQAVALRREQQAAEKQAANELERLRREKDGELAETRDSLNRQLLELQSAGSGLAAEAKRRAELEARAELEKLRLELEQAKQRALDEMGSRMEREREQARSEMVGRFAAELDGHSSSYRQQLAALQAALEQSKAEAEARERALAQRTDSLRADCSERERKIDKLLRDAEVAREEATALRRSLEAKGREANAARTEFDDRIRKREEEISVQYEARLLKVREEAAYEKQRVITEFSKAQELLKMKILDYKQRLEDSEDRLRKRDPRPEDVEAIQGLRARLSDREAEVAKLVEDMRFYKNELINRETNYNKVFNSRDAPQVGLVNPLAMKQKKRNSITESPSQSAASSSGSLKGKGRLAPLPGSPMHDEPLTPSKPLPPASVLASGSSKKFL